MKTAITFKKVTLIVTGLLLTSVWAAAQESKVKEKDVPPAVIAAFKAAYPNATIKGYAKEKENGKLFYEIESKDGAAARDILYNPDGTVAEVEETIAASDLPAAAQEALQSKYPKAVVTKAEKTTQGDKVEYEVIAKRGKQRISLTFDASGKLLKHKAS
jgi:Putative beta-lactamase-inhibitor-like, PepSY-like